MNRTKIVATLGPASGTEQVISRLVDAGANVFRLNLKHGDAASHTASIRRIRRVASAKKASVGILLDLQGPEIRIGAFARDSIKISAGDNVLFTDIGDEGSEGRIILKSSIVLKGFKAGQRFFIDDGNFEFEVASSRPHRVSAKVIRGGVLHSRKSVNLPYHHLPIPVLSGKDRDYISMGIRENVDFFALSFVRSVEDIRALKAILKSAKSGIQVIAKIERPEAVDNFDSILAESDGVMVARGDLGIEIPLPEVPLVQKEIIRKCRDAGKPVITATQMLESMVSNHRPTRAEVSDVANAILDGTDAVMLSAESAIGSYPVDAVSMMSLIDAAVASHASEALRMHHYSPATATEAVSQAIDALSRNRLGFRAIVLLTETGKTARMVSRFRSHLPIYAAAESRLVANQLALTWGVSPVVLDFSSKDNGKLFTRIIAMLKKARRLSKGDRVICVAGSIIGKENITNSITIQRVA